jgi:hypothetical protein
MTAMPAKLTVMGRKGVRGLPGAPPSIIAAKVARQMVSQREKIR